MLCLLITEMIQNPPPPNTLQHSHSLSLFLALVLYVYPLSHPLSMQFCLFTADQVSNRLHGMRKILLLSSLDHLNLISVSNPVSISALMPMLHHHHLSVQLVSAPLGVRRVESRSVCK